MASNALTGRITLDGADDVARSLAQLAQQGQDVARKLGDAFKSIGNVGTPTDNIKRGLDDVAQAGQKAFDTIGRSGQKAFKDVATAAASIKIDVPTEQPKQQLSSLGDIARSAFDGISKAADGIKSAFDGIVSSVRNAASEVAGFKSAVVGIAAAGGAVALIRAAYKQASEAVADFNKTQTAASALGTSLENYQKLTFLLREIGLDADQAQKALEQLKPAASEKLTSPGGGKIISVAAPLPDISALKALQDELKNIDGDQQKLAAAKRFFNDNDEAAKAFVATLGEERNAVDAVVERFDKLRSVTTRPTIDADDLKKQANELKSAVDSGDLEDRLQRILGGFKGRTDLANQFVDALNAGSLDAFFAKLKSIGDAEDKIGRGSGLTKLADRVRSVGSDGADNLSAVAREAQQIALATKAFGGDEEQAAKFVAAANAGTEAVAKFIDGFRQLPQAVRTATDVASDFTAAQKNLSEALYDVGFASKQGQTSLGLLFAPVFTPIINAIADAIRKYRVEIAGLAKDLSGSVSEAASDFFKLFEGKTFEIKTDWIASLADGLGAVGTLISSVAIPAFEGLKATAAGVASAMNEAFGTKISAAVIGIAAALIPLVGGWKAVAAAVLAAVGIFASTGEGAEKLRASLGGMGIDLDGLKEKFGSIGTVIKQAFASISGANAGASWGEILKSSLTGVPGIILGIVAALVALRSAAAFVAPVLGRAIGREVTGDAVLFVGALGQITGILPTIATALGAVAAAATSLFFGLRSVGLLLSGMAALVGWPVTLAAGLVLLLTNLDTAKEALDAVAAAINAIFGTDFTGGGLLAGALALLTAGLVNAASGGRAAAAATDLVSAAVVRLDAVIAGSALGRFASGLSVFAAAILPLIIPSNKESGLGLDQEKAQDALTKKLNRGELTPEQYAQRLRDLQKNVEDAGNKGASAGEKALDVWKQIQETLKNITSGPANPAAAAEGASRNLAPSSSPFIRQPDKNTIIEPKNVDDAGQKLDTLKQKVDATASDIKQKIDGGSASVEGLTTQIDGSGTAVDAVKDRIDPAFDALKEKADDGSTSTDGLTTKIDATGNAIDDVKTHIDATFDAFDARIDGTGDKLDGLKSKLEDYAQQLLQLQGSLGEGTAGGGAGGGGGSGFAEGGYISGPGSNTSDSILARLSNGEFVLSADATRRIGVDRLNAINSGHLPGFASGGLAGNIITLGGSSSSGFDDTVRRFNEGVLEFRRVVETLAISGYGDRGDRGDRGSRRRRSGGDAGGSDDAGAPLTLSQLPFALAQLAQNVDLARSAGLTNTVIGSNMTPGEILGIASRQGLARSVGGNPSLGNVLSEGEILNAANADAVARALGLGGIGVRTGRGRSIPAASPDQRSELDDGFQKVAEAFSPVRDALTQFGSAIGTAKDDAAAAGTQFAGIGDKVQEADGALDGLSKTAGALDSAFTDVSSTVAGKGGDDISSSFQDASQAADGTDTALGRLQQAADAASQTLGDLGGGSAGAASGGLIQGPGTATSDSILARLSNGEFVLNAAATRHYGVPALHAMNARRFHLGGLVDRFDDAMPSLSSFRDGGEVMQGHQAGGGLHPITLHFGKQKVGGFLAPSDVISTFEKAAMLDQVTSMGQMSPAVR